MICSGHHPDQGVTLATWRVRFTHSHAFVGLCDSCMRVDHRIAEAVPVDERTHAELCELSGLLRTHRARIARRIDAHGEAHALDRVLLAVVELAALAKR